jgi:hypothetical protein
MVAGPVTHLGYRQPVDVEGVSGNPVIREGQILTGPLFSEPMRVETIRADGADAWITGLVRPAFGAVPPGHAEEG